MKHLHALVYLSFGLLPVYSLAQSFGTDSHDTNRQNAVAAVEEPHHNNNITITDESSATLSDWSKGEDMVIGSISRSKLMRMRAVTDALVDFLKDSCIGDGVYNPSWHGEYFSDRNSPGTQLKFGVTCHFADQGGADLNIIANDFQPLTDQLAVNGQHFLTIRVPSSTNNGSLFYDDVRDAAGGATKMWLITTGKSLPFIPVTRKEYLQEARAELMAMINSIVAGWKLKVPVRPADVQESEKKSAIDQLRAMYSGSELAVRIRMFAQNYKTDQEYQSENIKNETAAFAATIQLIDSLSAHLGAAALAKPAIVSVAAADFRGFEDGLTNYMLARINPEYFNAGVSEEKAQLFLVTWHCDPANMPTQVLDRELSEGLGGQGLQELLSR